MLRIFNAPFVESLELSEARIGNAGINETIDYINETSILVHKYSKLVMQEEVRRFVTFEPPLA